MAITTDINAAARALSEGLLVGVPTETVYGVAADATNPAAVRRLFAAKGRPADRPLPLLIGSAGALDCWSAGAGESARRLAGALWPGPLTLVVPRSEGVSDAVTAGHDTVGLRVPDHPAMLALLRTVGRPLATPSANLHGAISATCAEEVDRQLGARVALVLDGGPSALGLESTVVSVVADRVSILRHGALTASALAEVLGPGVTIAQEHAAATTRFRLATPVELVAAGELAARRAHHDAAGRSAGIVTDDTDGRGLYSRLGELDSRGYDVLLVDPGGNEVARKVLRHRLAPQG